MPVQVVWDNDDHTIIRYTLDEDWTWEDMRAAVVISNKMLDGVDHKVHFIHDATAVTGLPSDMLSQLRTFIDKEHPNTGQSVIVGAKKSAVIILAQSLLAMIHRLYKKDWGFMFADTLDEARGMLTKSTEEQLSR